ncbi:hypothetical protein BO78DRAFT_28376 [Aspergillus sclerotiicarbonarius CBS 121057]|uniref:Uncharacterized protein n=1 Tax=Aspergillus sclerotiicarbonarius (strain CBS 121057 / IBT 28362) TaxID=1448318 RepID=A0A319DTC5_ASPSB|nr:hypothetical protein BO78DRAFT_28376 [Aspergillus sclerotiicarbonarius CBS 121057]
MGGKMLAVGGVVYSIVTWSRSYHQYGGLSVLYNFLPPSPTSYLLRLTYSFTVLAPSLTAQKNSPSLHSPIDTLSLTVLDPLRPLPSSIPAWARPPSIAPLRSLHRPSPIPVSRPRARNSLASSPAQLRPFNSSADASVAFVYFPSASGPRCTNLILTVPVHIIPIPSDILTFIFILALLTLLTVAAATAAVASAPIPTLSPSVGLYRCRRSIDPPSLVCLP